MNSAPRLVALLSYAALILATTAGCSADPRPSVFIDTPLGLQSGNVPIDFTVKHRSEEDVDIEVIYSTDSGVSWHTATIVDAANTTKDLDSSASGILHSIEWDTVANSVATSCPAPQARIRILPVTPADKGREGTSDDFLVNNSTSSPPIISATSPVGILSDEIVVMYNVSDFESDLVSIQADFSTDGGASFATASLAPSSESTVDVMTTASGVNHSITWDSIADLGFQSYGQVGIRLRASDGMASPACESPSETSTFRVDNSSIVPRLYVTRAADSNLLEVDTNTGGVSLVGTGATSPHSIAAARLPTGSFVLFTDTAGGTVHMLNTDTNVVETVLTVQTAPKGILVHQYEGTVPGLPVHRAYVANSGSDTVTVIDLDLLIPIANRFVGAIGSEPTDLAVTSVFGFDTIYVTLLGENSVAPMDVDGFATGSTIPVTGIGPGPITAVESAFETFLYVGNTGSSTVTVIDSLTDQVVTSALVRESFPDPSGITSIRLPTGLDLVLVSCSGDGSVRVVDVNALHSPFATVQRAAIDPRGITALATHFGSRAYVVDTSSGEVGQIDLDLLEATGMGFPLPPISGLGTGILDVTSVR